MQLKTGEQVRAQFILDAAVLEASFRKLSGTAQFPQRLGKRVGWHRMAPVPARPNRVCVIVDALGPDCGAWEIHVVFIGPKISSVLLQQGTVDLLQNEDEGGKRELSRITRKTAVRRRLI
jgi:hypothetical protein